MSSSLLIETVKPLAEISVSDTLLLERFLIERDDSAFEKIVHRHGPSVLRICRQWLGSGQDADDACQATFVVLVNRAGEIRKTESLGYWLCGVARRVACRSKMRINQRRVREGAAMDIDDVVVVRGSHPDDLHPIVRSEVSRLPEKYRRAIELCYWEGLSSEQAARMLRCPTGTLKWRLTRAKEILRTRLARLSPAILVMLMGRIRGIEAAEGIPSGTLTPPTLKLVPSDQANITLSPNLVRETVALAAFVRDFPLSFMNDKAVSSLRKTWMRPPHLKLVLLLASLAAFIAVMVGVPAARQLQSAIVSRVIGTETKLLCH